MSNNFTEPRSVKNVWRNVAVAVFAAVFALIGLGVTLFPSRADSTNAVGDFILTAENITQPIRGTWAECYAVIKNHPDVTHTVVMQSDWYPTQQVDLNDGGKIIFDLNGKTVDGSEIADNNDPVPAGFFYKEEENIDLVLEITDSSTETKGTISNFPCSIFYLTKTKLNISAGNITMNTCRAIVAHTSTNVTMAGGSIIDNTVADSVMAVYYNKGNPASILITGGQIINNKCGRNLLYVASSDPTKQVSIKIQGGIIADNVVAGDVGYLVQVNNAASIFEMTGGEFFNNTYTVGEGIAQIRVLGSMNVTGGTIIIPALGKLKTESGSVSIANTANVLFGSVQDIDITNNRQNYAVGDTADLTVTAKFSGTYDSQTKTADIILSPYEYSVDYANGNSLQQYANTVTVTYGDKVATLPIFVGDELSPVNAIYDGTDQQIANMTDKPDWYNDGMQITYTQNGVDVTTAKKDVGEYTVTVQWGNVTRTTTLTVALKAVSVDASTIKAQDRTYNRERGVELEPIIVNGVVADDNVTVNANGVMDDKNAGENKPVVVTVTLTGTDAQNYVLTEAQFTTTVNITPQTVYINNVKAKDKEYDGTTRAILDTSDIDYTGFIKGDDLTVLVTGQYMNGEEPQSTFGDNLTVVLQYLGLDGLDKNNYQIATTNNQLTTTASIKKRVITVTISDQTVKVDTPQPTLTAKITSGSLASGDTAEKVYTLSIVTDAEIDPDHLPVGEYAIKGAVADDPVAQNYDITFVDGKYTVLTAEAWDALQTKKESDDNNFWLITIIVLAVAAFIGALVGIGLVVRSHDKNRDNKPQKEKKNKDKNKATAAADDKVDNH